MNKLQLLIIPIIITLLLAINRFFAEPSSPESYLGGLPWYGWAGISGFLALAGAAFALRDARRELRLLEAPVEPRAAPDEQRELLPKELLDKYDHGGPNYPHPVVITERCIGCHACVDACPQSVLAMVNSVAVVVARDQCVEEMKCQIECPVKPEACVVVNTEQVVPPRAVPPRDDNYISTQVPGCYIIGDVSGSPLIKITANEGAKVIEHIRQELDTPSESRAEFDVAIIGAGPAGFSAAVSAKQCGLSYVVIERDKVLSKIEGYPKDKSVFFKPDAMPARCALPIAGAEQKRELLLESWHGVMRDSGVVIKVRENCTAVERAKDGDYFIVRTEKGKKREPQTYPARRVVLALGKSGTPRRLEAKNEDMKITRGGQTEDKVLTKLLDPESFKRQRVAVVGAGNSAVEAAIALVVASRNEEQIEFRSPEEMNEVSLIVRSDFSNDLKFTNKMLIYRCMDEGKVKVHFGARVKEVRADEVVLMDSLTKAETGTIANDYVLALIGGDYPTDFLKSIGITIPKADGVAKAHEGATAPRQITSTRVS